jgi:hypothetical protein
MYVGKRVGETLVKRLVKEKGQSITDHPLSRSMETKHLTPLNLQSLLRQFYF